MSDAGVKLVEIETTAEVRRAISARTALVFFDLAPPGWPDQADGVDRAGSTTSGADADNAAGNFQLVSAQGMVNQFVITTL